MTMLWCGSPVPTAPMLLAMMKRRQPVDNSASISLRVPMRLCSCPLAILQPLGAPARCTQQSMRVLASASSSPGASRSLSTYLGFGFGFGFGFGSEFGKRKGKGKKVGLG